ncbi:MAG: transposase InsO family protein, partial [Saprospiraceae bacterium]
PKKTYMVSLMDDASRLVTHSYFSFNEQAESIEYALQQALLKRGLPKRLIVDNGPAYISKSLKRICAKLGIHLIYCRPYEPEGKAYVAYCTSLARFVATSLFCCFILYFRLCFTGILSLSGSYKHPPFSL